MYSHSNESIAEGNHIHGAPHHRHPLRTPDNRQYIVAADYTPVKPTVSIEILVAVRDYPPPVSGLSIFVQLSLSVYKIAEIVIHVLDDPIIPMWNRQTNGARRHTRTMRNR